MANLFLSTPSARRATREQIEYQLSIKRFLSTPSARRATCRCSLVVVGELISIHALREEGDARSHSCSAATQRFLSTPSARRATLEGCVKIVPLLISIHALREEGDE